VIAAELQPQRRTPAKRKAHQLATTLRHERPDYVYLKEVFRQLRAELGIVVPRTPKRLPYVPSEEEIRRYYETVWKTRKLGDLVLIKTLLYTGVRVSELVAIRLTDVDFDRCQVRINEGKGRKDRVVPFPSAFKETLALHNDRLRQRGASFLFESSWKKPYSDRGVRRLLERYATAAGLAHPIAAGCREDEARRIDGRAQTVGEALALERQHLRQSQWAGLRQGTHQRLFDAASARHESADQTHRDDGRGLVRRPLRRTSRPLLRSVSARARPRTLSGRARAQAGRLRRQQAA
jgi:integrase/recombinase XerD